MKPISLGEFVDLVVPDDSNDTPDVEAALVALKAKAPLPPKMVENLRKLKKLELLTDEVIWSLLAQAPIDPLGVYGAMKGMGVWAFSPVDFTMVQVLAKSGNMPVALMRIDLMSDDLVFVALNEQKHLVQCSVIEADFLASKLASPNATEQSILALIQQHMKGAVDTGLKNAGVAKPS